MRRHFAYGLAAVFVLAAVLAGCGGGGGGADDTLMVTFDSQVIKEGYPCLVIGLPKKIFEA